MNIVFLDTNTMGPGLDLSPVSKLGGMISHEITLPEDRFERCKNAEIIITNKVAIDAPLMEQLDNLKLICVAATGTNNIDMDYAAARGIPVKNAINYSTHSVAQVTFSMILYLLQRTAYYDHYVKSGGFSDNSVFCHIAHDFTELAGKKFGIIGLGNIGKKVAEIANAFGAEVVYYSSSGKNDNPHYKRLSLDQLLTECDIISIHAPLNDFTRDLIGEKELEKMKSSSILVNAGRGGIVDETALAFAIDEEKIYGACLDVFGIEPIAADNPLLRVKNPERLVLMPHIAWASIEARTTLVKIIAGHIRDFLNTQN
ncbi:MAG: D-2-hydroxyacid dehydrogenase [Cyclobacteriaceae bacterium]|nr:D-2-hydroxyacid dehydrogenase [Cyclobacteriaceae bacterium]